MKVAIVYKSLSGNTRMLAEGIRDVFSGAEVVYFGEPKKDIQADLYFVGSWTNKGMCDEEVSTFLNGLDGKNIAYFGTAGFSGSDKYYDILYNKVKNIIPKSNTVLGYFYCPGKMPMKIREGYNSLLASEPDNKKVQTDIQVFDRALSHPDNNDIENVQKWALEMAKLTR